ncbi:MAG TPA: hypothetical protein VL727_29175 [Puia sp.]|jgi:hypothetical protein|nr:hypothetical protein [Puia sp.]
MSDLFGYEKMLALSWKPPFGSAMLVGKDETRVWDTKYRGLVLICNSKVGYSIPALEGITGLKQYDRLKAAVFPVRHTLYYFGMAIAVGRLVNCRPMQPDDEYKTFVRYRAPWIEERRGKDGKIRRYHRRLYCHIYEDMREIEPFPWQGSQGWSEVTDEVKAKIKFK